MLFFRKRPDVGRLHATRNVRGLVKALRYREWTVRSLAAARLGELRDPAAVSALIAALQDETICANAAIALGEIKDQRAVQPLLAMLQDPACRARKDVAKALGSLDDPAARPALLATLAASADSDTRAALIRALAPSGSIPVPDLVAMRDDPEWQVRMAADDGLAALGARAVPALVERLGGSATPGQRRALVQLLARIPVAEVVEPLRKGLGDDDAIVSEVAMRGLETLGTRLGLPADAAAELKAVKTAWLESRLSAFPGPWRDDTAHRASLLAIIEDPRDASGQGCPYYRFGACLFRVEAKRDLATGPERCSLQRGEYRGCFVWQMSPR